MKIHERGEVELPWVPVAVAIMLAGSLAGIGFLVLRKSRFRKTAHTFKKAERICQQELVSIPRQVVEPLFEEDETAA